MNVCLSDFYLSSLEEAEGEPAILEPPEQVPAPAQSPAKTGGVVAAKSPGKPGIQDWDKAKKQVKKVFHGEQMQVPVTVEQARLKSIELESDPGKFFRVFCGCVYYVYTHIQCKVVSTICIYTGSFMLCYQSVYTYCDVVRICYVYT